MDDTRSMLAALNGSFPDIASMHPLDARAAADSRVTPTPEPGIVASADDVTVQTAGGDIGARIYRPHAPLEAAPLTIYAHGGGFLHGSIASHDRFCRAWAAQTGSTVVSVDYRLAPEHVGPAPVNDVVAVTEWALATGLAPHGVVLAGDSSGANLAAVAAIVLRDQGESPVVGQVLIYPFLDPTMSSESHRRLAEGYFVTGRLLRFYWETYLGGPLGASAPDWRVMPLAAASHSDLPPSITITAGLDPLADEGREYAALLRRSGNEALHRHYPEQFHGFLTIPNYPPAAAAQELLWSDIAELFRNANKEQTT